jgi:hypothetical protein
MRCLARGLKDLQWVETRLNDSTTAATKSMNMAKIRTARLPLPTVFRSKRRWVERNSCCCLKKTPFWHRPDSYVVTSASSLRNKACASYGTMSRPATCVSDMHTAAIALCSPVLLVFQHEAGLGLMLEGRFCAPGRSTSLSFVLAVLAANSRPFSAAE